MAKPQLVTSDYYAELPADTEPTLSEAVRLLFQYSYGLRDEVRRLRATAITADVSGADLESLREKLLANFPATSLNIANLVGVLAEPQKAGIPIVTALPNPAFAFNGEVVSLNGLLYVFDASVSPPPGAWVVLATGVVRIAQTITAPVTIANPNATTVVAPAGTTLRYVITMDGSGGHAVSWAAEFKGISPLTVGRTANRVSVVQFDVLSTNQFVLFAERGDIAV